MFTYNTLVSFLCGMIGMMPYYPAEEEDPNQSEWQLVVSFCCKGMIEGVILMLLLWLLIQVLFVSNLEGKLLDTPFSSLNSHTVDDQRDFLWQHISIYLFLLWVLLVLLVASPSSQLAAPICG